MNYLPIFYTSLIVIVIIILLGFLLGRLKIINAVVNRGIADLLLTVAMPCALFSAFPQEFNHSSWELFAKASLGGALVLISAIILSRFLFRRKKIKANYFQHQFAFVFNNASFLGYPLTLAIFGSQSMIAYSGLMLVFNLALFSYGVWLFQQKLTLKHLREIFLNPNVMAVILGLICFLNSWHLPEFANQTVNYLAGLTTPLSLLCVGFVLSQIRNWRKLWQKKQIFLTCFLQLTLMPMLTYLILSLLQMPILVKQIFTMIQALPTAISLEVFAEKYGGDVIEASELVLVSTLMSALTLPVVMLVIFSL